jgi:putative tricarboxylic transport membrane protein
MRKADRNFGIVCLGISLWLILEGMRWDYSAGFTPGPGFEPIWLGVILACLASFLIFDSFRRKESKDDSKKIFPEKQALFRVALILIIFSGFAIILGTFGFELTVFIFVALILYLLEGYKIGKSIFYGAAFSGTLFLIFRYWMQIQLPRGFLGF